MKVTKQYRTETGHRLMNYDGKCSHLHGHSYLWEVTAESINLDNGMVLDFKDLKKAMVQVLEPFDHCMVLHKQDPIQESIAQAPATNGAKQRVILVEFNPTAENFAFYARREIQRLMPDHVDICSVRVWETATSYAESQGV